MFSLCAVCAIGTASAQDRPVKLSSQRISIRDAFREIEVQSNYSFAIGHSGFDMLRTVELSSKQGSTKVILDELLQGSGRTYQLAETDRILIIPEKLEEKEKKRIVAVPFDWAKSYTDADFARDMEKDIRYREAHPEKEPQPLTRIEVTEITDSIFFYPKRHIELPKSGSGWYWEQDQRPAGYFALKTNLLYGALAQAPNIAAEIALGPRSTLDLTYGVNNWNKSGSDDKNKKMRHWYVRPEYRYWLCNRFNGHFFGGHAFYWNYNVSQHKIPMLFKKKYQYEGNTWGFGVSYGYHWMLNRHWGLEANVGVGVAFLRYDQYGCVLCGDRVGRFSKTYVGPTSLGVKLVYVIK